MSPPEADVPEVVVKPGKMVEYWSGKLRGLVVLVAMAVYIYFLFFIKVLYLKSNRLDRVMAMAVQTEKMMHQVHATDRILEAKLDNIKNFYDDTTY